jgi:hypothetical protein
MTPLLIALGVSVAYTHIRSKALLRLVFLELQEIAENRSEFQKHLLIQDNLDDPEMIESIENGSYIRYEDMENNEEIKDLVVERASLLFVRNLCFSVSVILLFI